MASYLIGEKFFRDVVVALLQDTTGFILPSRTAEVVAGYAGGYVFDKVIPDLFGKAFFDVLSKWGSSERQTALDELARMPFASSWQTAAEEVAASDLQEDQKHKLVRYLSAVPMTSRQALNRWNDGGHVTTLPSQLPKSPAEASRFGPVRPPLFAPDDKIPGYDLQLETLLGQGGFAEVWKARYTERQGEPPVALKFCVDQELMPSLKREIDVLDQLKIRSQEKEQEKDFVQLIGTAYSADPPFLVYEYVGGGNLSNWVESVEDGVPAPKDVISILKMIARAAALAHDHGIVHRDLKPTNILITKAGRAKIADFGIGTVVADSVGGRTDVQDDDKATQSRGAFTPMYSDSRRSQSDPPHPKDDVYAIGVIAYQLLEGDVSVRMDGSWQKYLKNRGVDIRLIDIIETCVAPKEQRFSNAGALLAALERLKSKGPDMDRSKDGVTSTAGTALNYCHQCGHRLQPRARFCVYCRYRLP